LGEEMKQADTMGVAVLLSPALRERAVVGPGPATSHAHQGVK